MEMPDDLDRCLLILVLRAVGCNHDAVASIVRCHKLRIGEVERWFRKMPWREATQVCEDQAIKRIVGRDLVSLEEVENTVIVKAAQITGDDILRHFRKDYLERPGEDALLPRAWENHNTALLQIAARLVDEVVVPSSRECLEGRIDSGLAVESAEDSRRLFGDLLEHLAGSVFGYVPKALGDIKRRRVCYWRLHLELLERVDRDMNEAYSAEVEPIFTKPYRWTPLLPKLICEGAIGATSRECSNARTIARVLRWEDMLVCQKVEYSEGRYGIVRPSEKMVELYGDIYERLRVKYKDAQPVNDILEARRELEGLVTKIKDELRGLQFRALVPGRCRDCP